MFSGGVIFPNSFKSNRFQKRMTYARTVLRGVLAVFVLGVLSSVLGYFLRIYLARTLPTEQFGLVYAVMGLFGLIALLIYWGFPDACTKFLSDFRAKKNVLKVMQTANSVLFIELTLSVLFGIVSFFLAGWLAEVYFKTPLAVPLIQIYAIAIILSPIEEFLVGIFRSYQKNLWLAFVRFTRAALLLVGTILFFSYLPSIGLSAAILPYPLAYIVIFIFFTPFLYKLISNLKISPKLVNKNLLNKIFIFSIPLALTTASYALLTHTDTVIITYFRSLEEVGLYNAALPVANLLTFFGASVATVFMPVVAELWTKRKKALLAGSLSRAYVLITIAIVPFVAAFLAFPDVIINILFGGPYVEAKTALQVLSVAAIFATFTLFNYAVLSGIGKPALMTKAVVAGTVINLVSNIIIVPFMGYTGAAISTLVAQLLIFSASTVFLLGMIKFNFPIRKFLLTILAGILLVGIASLLRVAIISGLFLKLSVVGVVGAIFYTGFIYLTGVLTRGDVREIYEAVVGK